FVLAEMLRNEKARPKLFKRLVQRKARSVARNLDQRSGRLANIERIEIGPVMNGGGAEFLRIEIRMKGFHFGPGAGAEGDMVDRAGSRRGGPEAGRITNIDDISDPGHHAPQPAVFRCGGEPRVAPEEIRRLCRLLRPYRHAAQPRYRLRSCDSRHNPWSSLPGKVGSHQLYDNAVRIRQAQ